MLTKEASLGEAGQKDFGKPEAASDSVKAQGQIALSVPGKCPSCGNEWDGRQMKEVKFIERSKQFLPYLLIWVSGMHTSLAIVSYREGGPIWQMFVTGMLVTLGLAIFIARQ